MTNRFILTEHLINPPDSAAAQERYQKDGHEIEVPAGAYVLRVVTADKAPLNSAHVLQTQDAQGKWADVTVMSANTRATGQNITLPGGKVRFHDRDNLGVPGFTAYLETQE
jgi:hypothetical protein